MYTQPIIDATDMDRIIRRLAHEILERSRGVDKLALVGIQTRGVVLAKRLQHVIEAVEQTSVPLGQMDITEYRDDRGESAGPPTPDPTPLPFSVDGCHVVIVDDVLFTGRTIRAAMDALIDHGRPQRITLSVLVDRGHRELPIQADFVGKALETRPSDTVSVNFKEIDGLDQVIVSFGPIHQR